MKRNSIIQVVLILFFFLITASQGLGNDIINKPFDEAQVDQALMELEQNMSTVTTVHAKFVQKKVMAMFDIPVIIKGEFYIQNPDKFAWIVTEPIEYTLIVTKDKVIKWDKSNGRQELSLKDNPMFKAMIGQITFWFSGSYASCKNDYDLSLIQKNPDILEFTPKGHNPASEMLANITLVFQQDKKYISKITLLEKNADITELFFKNVQLNSIIEKSVWELN